MMAFESVTAELRKPAPDAAFHSSVCSAAAMKKTPLPSRAGTVSWWMHLQLQLRLKGEVPFLRLNNP
jgi:hypothetical protein